MANTGIVGVNLDQMQSQMNEMLQTQIRATMIQTEYATKSSIVKGTGEAKQSMARNMALQH